MKTFDPVDPGVKIPAAVKAAADRAQAAFEALNPPPADHPADPPVDPPAPPSPPSPETALTAEPPAPPPPADPEENPPRPIENGSLEQQYASMKGRWEKSKQQVQTLSAQLSEALSRITQLEAATKVAPKTEERLVTDEDINTYGEDFIDVGRRVAREEVQTLRQKISELEGKFSQVSTKVTKDARSSMIEALNKDVPSWLAINESEDFLEWTALPDTYSGVIRRDLLQGAFDQNDTARVLAFFKGFLSEEAAVAPANGDIPVPSPEPGPGRVPLEAFAAPGRAKTAAAPPAPAEKPIITRAQISQFYTDSARGVYRGRDEEKARLEAMIFEARQEGRIR